ncbi:unnamed protein product [Leptidea sinapis]|uniref:Galactosyltransferase N-terminal domain-containing protein n=1 Tax=Leptidea sinapis TaxID=189913 RepID=A0A5E4PU89_9NEOP|nr:unnamed protein product [Leptidea sinapis]
MDIYQNIDSKAEYSKEVPMCHLNISILGTQLYNRGKLLNAGFHEMMKLGDWNCVIFHDLLLPLDEHILISTADQSQYTDNVINASGSPIMFYQHEILKKIDNAIISKAHKCSTS